MYPIGIQSMERKRYNQKPAPGIDYGVPKTLTEHAEGHLTSSEVQGTTSIHMPVIDMDYSIEAVKTPTDDHHHLYINKPITWRMYKRLLRALLKANLIEKGWFDNAMKEKKSLVFHPSWYQKKALDVLMRQDIRRGWK